jgi:hypothetical protein
MTDQRKTLNHPTFGPCALVPNLMAIRWATPRDSRTVDTTLSELSLERAEETSPKPAPGQRNPAEPEVNDSTLLTWIGGTKAPSDKKIAQIEADPNVAWIAPVYTAARSEGGPRSYFAVDPTVLVLSEAAAGSVGDPKTLDAAATIDRTRTNLLKGFVVVNFPNKNAIEIGQRLLESGTVGGIPNAVNYENVPYLSPACCGCGGGCGGTKPDDECAPARTPVIPNDPIYPQQWGLQRINAPSAWAITTGDPNIVVAVLDQGVDLLHPDISLYPISYNTVTHLNDGSPIGPHGTACAGIVSGRINSGAGVAGLAGTAKVMAIATGWSDVQVAEGLYFAADNGARVVSMSFGVYPSWMIWNFALIESALQYCYERNLVLVAASGNENIPQSRFPGSDPRTICIGGSNRDDVRKSVGDTSSEPFWGACYGSDLDVVAPCLEIPTTDQLGPFGYVPGDYDLTFNGTSSATPHVAALAGLILSIHPAVTNVEVREIISSTTDKINAGGYVYLPAGGKPYGTWNSEAGYGRINAERALLAACSSKRKCKDTGPGAVEICEPEPCCVSPCDPPWRTETPCLIFYEEKFFRVPLNRDDNEPFINAAVVERGAFIELRVRYEYRMCLVGKQHGPLLFTTTLLPGETIRLYHSERYRRITSTEMRFSVQSTFMQFLSKVHQAHVTNSVDTLQKQLSTVSTSGSTSAGGGFNVFGLFGGGASAESSFSATVSSESMLATHAALDVFEQSVQQSSQLTHTERSIVVSTFEDRENQDITARTLHNANECRAVTYFVRQVVELYAISARVADVSYRIVAGNVPSVWHSSNDIAWLPKLVQNQILQILALLPKSGEVIERPRPFTLPTDGTVYNPELAHCCSCEPERAAAIAIRLEKEKAEAMKLGLEVQQLEAEVRRRRLLLDKGELGAFDALPAVPVPGS